MSTSLIGGLIEKGRVSSNDIYLFEPNADKAHHLANTYKVNLVSSNVDLILECDIMVIAVKPQVLQSVLEPLKEALQKRRPMIISVVAGINANSIASWSGGNLPIVRVMPNTPALIGMGASGLFANTQVSKEQYSLAEELMSAVGKSAWVPNENDIDSVTALSGSGPAYFMLFIQSLISAAESAGIAPHTAKMLAVQTAAGAAEMVSNTDLPVQTLIDNVTSPNGTTERALESFAKDNLSRVVQNAFNAAKQRSEELAKELG